MRKILILLLLPVLSFAECHIELVEIKPAVKTALAEMHDKSNSSIDKSEFSEAQLVISEVLVKIDQCRLHHHAFEHKNYHFDRWGEKSDKYFNYLFGLQSVDMQLLAAVDSFELSSIVRAFIFDEDMWEKVTFEFYETEI